jgi:hypothetical protein
MLKVSASDSMHASKISFLVSCDFGNTALRSPTRDADLPATRAIHSAGDLIMNRKIPKHNKR